MIHHRGITKKHRHWLQSPWVAWVLLIVVLWASIAVVTLAIKFHEAFSLRSEDRRELSELHNKDQELAIQIESLSTDRGKEAEVRNRYRVVRPGEQLVIVVDGTSSENNLEGDENNKTLFEKIKYFIGF